MIWEKIEKINCCGVNMLIGKGECGDVGIVGLGEGDATDERKLWRAGQLRVMCKGQRQVR